MNKITTFAKRLAALATTVMLTPVVIAQTAPAAPTTAVGLAQAIDLTDAKNAVLIVIAALIALGVTIWGATLVYKKFRP
jgi:hypothetical protein